jgi:hypothetical protein
MPSVAVHYMELSTKTIRWLWQLMVAGSSRWYYTVTSNKSRRSC